MISTLKKKLNKKGFTLAELLVVVAIIAILVAVAIPVFSSSTAKAEKAVIKANLRSVYAEAVVDALQDGTLNKSSYTIDGETYTVTETGTVDSDSYSLSVAVTPSKGALKTKACSYDGNAYTNCD